MGVARMSEDPADGVTNRWGRLHDMPNLFVSDGSLFPSSAAPNPTLTIVALAIRQAGHIAEAMLKKDI
jgi:choline dehydrogenase-like flavoprotein